VGPNLVLKAWVEMSVSRSSMVEIGGGGDEMSGRIRIRDGNDDDGVWVCCCESVVVVVSGFDS